MFSIFIYLLFMLRYILCLGIAYYDANYFQKREAMLKLASLSPEEYIKHFNYPFEAHKVTTEDGYIITLFRVPHGRNDKVSKKSESNARPVIYFLHGLMSFGTDIFLSGPDKALGFLLADAGFDVWCGNARGNRYSRAHVKLNPDTDKKYWTFSFNEIGTYDVPASIDYALNYTNQKKLFYIGHSQGTTTYFAFITERPEYNAKIYAQFSLSPVTFMTYVRGTLRLILTNPLTPVVDAGAESMSVYELQYDHPVLKEVFHPACNVPFAELSCISSVFLSIGYNMKQMNLTLFPLIVNTYPAGASVQCMMHYFQLFNREEFAKFDYGIEENQSIYNSTSPPRYNLSRVTAPVYLLCSSNDYMSSMRDCERLYNTMPNSTKKVLWKVADPMWNHIDYLFAIQGRELVYDRIIKIMKSYLN